MDDIENDNSQRVLEFIQKNPGSHLRQIKRELSMSIGTIQYHLKYLEKQGRITSEKQNMYRYYFPVGMFKQNEKNILKVFKQETAREIIMIIIEKKNPTQKELVDALKLSAPSISWNIDRLIEYDLVDEIRDGKFKRYILKENPQNIVSLMKNYHVGIWNTWSDRLAEMFLSMSKEEKDESS